MVLELKVVIMEFEELIMEFMVAKVVIFVDLIFIIYYLIQLKILPLQA